MRKTNQGEYRREYEILPGTLNMKYRKWYKIYNVRKEVEDDPDYDICLHRTLRGAKQCRKEHGGDIVIEKAEHRLLKDIDN